MKLFSLAFLLLAFPGVNRVSNSEPEGIQWMTLEEASRKMGTEKRKIMVDLYTDWCGWCKRMDSTTFADSQLAAYINTHFYPVKFNAEQREDILFRGKNYRFVSQGKGGYHELAAEITGGRLSYPTFVFLDENLQVIQSINGYREKEEFEKILAYFGGNFHRKVPWDRFTSQYPSFMPNGLN